MIREAIAAVVAGKDLSRQEATQVMEEMMTGEATPAQMGAFLTALRLKGETVEEIAGFASVMRAKATRVEVPFPTLDTCGTGGDGAGTINVSTAAAFVAAGAGIRVAKHGNRAASSHCGSADVLEALGAKIDLGPEGVRRCLEEVGVGFMFAPAYHPATRHAVPVRREIGIRNVFNILGPLTNPAGAQHQVLGVPHAELVPKVAQALQMLGCRHVLVVHSEDGLDELSLGAPTQVWEILGDSLRQYVVDPQALGLPRQPLAAVKGGDAGRNAAALQAVLGGETGPHRDFVLLNAAAALVAGDKAQELREGLALSAEIIQRGAAKEKLEAFIRLSRQLAEPPL